MSEWPDESITEPIRQPGLNYEAGFKDGFDEEDAADIPAETVEKLRDEVRRSKAAHDLALERESAAAEHTRLTAERLFRSQQRLAAGLERDLEESLRRTPAAERVLPAIEDHYNIRPIVEGLMSRSSAVRLDAKQRYNDLGFEVVGPLLKLIQREGARRNRRIALATGMVVFTLVLVFGTAIFAPILIPSVQQSTVNGVILAILMVLLFSTGPSPVQKKAAQLISEFDDPRLIGPLADALNTIDGYTTRVASGALKRMLPRVRASDPSSIPPETMAILYRALNGSDADLTIAILRSLEQIGDEKAFPFVEKLAEMNPTSSAGRRVKKAAVDCLPGLLDRTRKGAVSQTLLRAAHAPESAESLLRPAANETESDPMELLRAADAEG